MIYLHFIEEYTKGFGVNNLSVSDTHPAAKDRVFRLFSNLGKKAPVEKCVIDEMFSVAEEMSEVLQFRLEYLKDEYDDLLGFYGSIYLPSYKKRISIDRLDF